jgi:hypothetical protein
MWVSKSEVEYLRERVRELEAALKDERAENRRVERHYGDMLLRRAGTFPVPPLVSTPPEQAEPAAPPVTDSDIAKYEAVKEEGLRMGMGQQEIADAVRASTGWSEQDIARAIKGQNGNGHQ